MTITENSLEIQLSTTYTERFGGHRVGEPYFAGLPCLGYAEQVVELAPGAQDALTAAPNGAYQLLLIAADVNTAIVVGWVQNGVTTELTVNQLALVTPPTGVTPYVRNAGATGSPSVSVKALAAY